MKKSGNKNILIKTLQLIIAAFVAKGFGFVREMVLANYYGASATSDVYVAVQNIPAVIFSVFGTAVVTGFIPLYSEINVRNGKDKADRFANNVFNIFLLLAIILTVAGIVFSKELVYVFAGGFSGKTFDLCNTFAKIIMPTSIAIILVYVYNAYLQLEGHFNQNSLMNVPYNVIQILFIVGAFYINNVYCLAIGILLASFSQFLYLRILVARKTKFRHNPILDLRDPHIIKMLILVGPVFISTGVNQLNTIIDRTLASRLVEGSISALNYASEVTNIIVQVIILSLTTILYPKMTRLFAENNRTAQGEFSEKYINVVSVLVLPLSGLLFVFSDEVIQILFGRGAFNGDTVRFVSAALKAYAVGIAGVSFRDVLNKFFYAMKDTVTPMINGIIAVVCNISMNFLLIGKYEYIGLAVATSVASTVTTISMFIKLFKKMPQIRVKWIIKEFAAALAGTLTMCVAGSLFLAKVSIQNVLLRSMTGGCLCVLVYGTVLFIVKETMIHNLVMKFVKPE